MLWLPAPCAQAHVAQAMDCIVVLYPKVGKGQPRSQALPSCLRKDPGWGWSRVTRISRGKLKLSLG